MDDGAEGSESPWVCPNDRELCLRAKLQSGWSYHTNRKPISKKNEVKREELETISEILRKAENVALREEYRVGRLLDRVENIKNNAKGNGVTTCLLCDEKFGKITTSPMKCNICEKAACAKCGVDTTSSGNVPIWLCKLCNEQREFWKKSGGWFFRQIPQHKLPDVRQRGHLESGSFVMTTPDMNRKTNLLSQASELYSDSDQESSYSSEDFLDDDRRNSFTTKSREKLPSNHHPQPDLNDTSEPGLPSPRAHSRRLVHDTGDLLSRSRTPSPLSSNPSLCRSSQVSNDLSDETSSVNSRNSQILDSRDGRTVLPNSSDRPESLLHEVEDLFQTYGPDYQLTGPLGVLEFTVNYLQDVKRLDIHIHSARGLRAMDSSGSSDPYVKIHMLPGASKSNKMRTSTIKKTLDPLFNEILSYHGITENDMKNKTLRLQVLDEDKLSRNDFIGQTTVPLEQVLRINNKKMQKVLEPKQQLEYEEYYTETSPGRIQVSLRYDAKEQKLVVGIIRCSNLLAMDSNGYSDPYVKCYLLPDPSKKTKRRTRVKKRNLNPEFNEHFYYKIEHTELASRTLEVTVWDHDVGSSNDFIGGIRLGVNARDTLLKQWFETLKHQNKETTYWHNLSADIAPQSAD